VVVIDMVLIRKGFVGWIGEFFSSSGIGCVRIVSLSSGLLCTEAADVGEGVRGGVGVLGCSVMGLITRGPTLSMSALISLSTARSGSFRRRRHS